MRFVSSLEELIDGFPLYRLPEDKAPKTWAGTCPAHGEAKKSFLVDLLGRCQLDDTTVSCTAGEDGDG